MSNESNSMDGSGVGYHDTEPDDSVARLMHLAGPRAAVSEDLQARVYQQIHREWLDMLKTTRAKNRISRIAVPLALAASLLVSVTFLTRPVPLEIPVVGTVAKVSIKSGASTKGLAVGDIIRVGDTVRTGGGRLLSIALSNGASFRVAANTSLQLDEQLSFTLLKGEIYADSGQFADGKRNLEIFTELGVITDVGTQFLVSYRDAVLSVAVREGRVDVSAERETYTALAGNLLTRQAGGNMTRSEISTTDNAWNWTLAVAPNFDIDNKSLLDFLTWVARETGKELIFASDELRRAAMTTILHGSIEDFTPVETVAMVLATTTFEYKMGKTSIVVGR